MKKILLITLTLSLLSTMVVSADEEATNVEPVLYEEVTIDGIPVPVLFEETEEVVPVLIETEESVTEPQPELIMDGGALPIFTNDRNAAFGKCAVTIEETNVDFDVEVMVLDGVVYLPLRFCAENLGYEVTWNSETESVDLIKGAKFTTVYIGKNSYFKNRMAPGELSGPPFVTEGRTLVPIEFFYTILEESFVIDSNTVVFNNDMMAIHSGYIQSVEYDETGNVKITISYNEVSEGMEDLTIIHTNSYFTVYQKELEEGLFVKVLASPVMAMSIPGQTSGYVIY